MPMALQPLSALFVDRDSERPLPPIGVPDKFGVRRLPTIGLNESGEEEEGTAFWCPFGEHWDVPGVFEYVGTGPSLIWRVVVMVIEGRPQCVALNLDTPDGAAISAKKLRDFPL